MKVTVEIKDYSIPAKVPIKVHNAWHDSNKVELEVDGQRYTVVSEEIVSAIKRATLGREGLVF